MMLKYVGTYLHADDYDREFRSEFGFRSRYVGNFLSRRLRALGFDAKGFNTIGIEGRRQPHEACPIDPGNSVLANVLFDDTRYNGLLPGQHHEFFVEMLIEGIEKCARHHRIPRDELMVAIEDFRRGGYRNNWTHQAKRLPALGLEASLLCHMDSARFTLALKIERGGSTIFNEQILETKPDELIFAHRFKDVAVEGRTIVVKDKFGEPLFSLDERSLK